MTVSIGSGLVHLVAGVRAYFAANCPQYKVDAGFRSRSLKGNQATAGANRVAFIPSDLSGTSGQLVPARQVGHWDIDPDGDGIAAARARPLVDWDRVITLSVWAVDKTNTRDELLQVAAVEALLEWTVRAVHAVVGADVVWGPVRFTLPVDDAYGLELLVPMTLQQPLFDLPEDVGTPSRLLTKGLT